MVGKDGEDTENKELQRLLGEARDQERGTGKSSGLILDKNKLNDPRSHRLTVREVKTKTKSDSAFLNGQTLKRTTKRDSGG